MYQTYILLPWSYCDWTVEPSHPFCPSNKRTYYCLGPDAVKRSSPLNRFSALPPLSQFKRDLSILLFRRAILASLTLLNTLLRQTSVLSHVTLLLAKTSVGLDFLGFLETVTTPDFSRGQRSYRQRYQQLEGEVPDVSFFSLLFS